MRMLKNTSFYGVYAVLLAILMPITSFAADDGLTAEEELLWTDIFGQEEQPKANTPQPSSNDEKDTDAKENISGLWLGYYEYDKPQGQPEGMFSAVIRDLGDRFLITFLEPKRSSNEYFQWAGNTTAKRQGQYIQFIKQYQTGDTQSKTKVEYNLTISHQGDIMSGTWTIAENVYGRAFFYRAGLDNLKAIKAETVN